MTASGIDISEFFSDPLADFDWQACDSEEDYRILESMNREMEEVRADFAARAVESLEISRNIVLNSLLWLEDCF